MKLDALKMMAVERLPGGLGIKDARDLARAAGKGAQAVKNLEKVLIQFGDKFTVKGKAELLRITGLSVVPTPINDKISAKTKAALFTAYRGIGGELGEPLTAISKSAVFAEVVLVKPMPGLMIGATITAMVPIGNFNPKGEYLDPNKVDQFYIKRQSGFEPPAIYGPFKLQPGMATGQVAIHDIDNGRTIEVKKGQDLVVALQSNPSTGCRWHVVSSSRQFGLPAKSEYLADVMARVIGAGGTEQFTWKTTGAFPRAGNTYQVEMAYSRGESDEPSKTFSFSVELV